jgi:hypothetical protein
MDEFNDSDISSLLNQIAGSSPDTMTAHKVVLGKVRRVRQRRVVTVGATAVIMVVSGAVAIVQNSNNRDGGSNFAVPLSPGDSQPVKVATTFDLAVTTTTITGAVSVDPIVPDPPIGTPSTQPSSNSTSPSNSSVVATTLSTNTQAPSYSKGPSAIPSSPTTYPPDLTSPPSTKAPETTSPPTTNAPDVTSPPSTQPPVTTPAPTVPESKTWSCGGGSAKYLVTSSGLQLIETTPAIGFEVSENQSKAAVIVVKFISKSKKDERKSVLKIKKSGLVSLSCEDENFSRDSDSSDSESNDNNDESVDD